MQHVPVAQLVFAELSGDAVVAVLSTLAADGRHLRALLAHQLIAFLAPVNATRLARPVPRRCADACRRNALTVYNTAIPNHSTLPKRYFVSHSTLQTSAHDIATIPSLSTCSLSPTLRAIGSPSLHSKRTPSTSEPKQMRFRHTAQCPWNVQRLIKVEFVRNPQAVWADGFS